MLKNEIVDERLLRDMDQATRRYEGKDNGKDNERDTVKPLIKSKGNGQDMKQKVQG
jgi:hypothetical protein